MPKTPRRANTDNAAYAGRRPSKPCRDTLACPARASAPIAQPRNAHYEESTAC